jgi:transcriptional regulator with XRE-family HTH domain
MSNQLTKKRVREALGFTLDRELAEFFGTTKQAVSRWPEDAPLPDGRQWQARALRPDVFAADSGAQEVA